MSIKVLLPKCWYLSFQTTLVIFPNFYYKNYINLYVFLYVKDAMNISEFVSYYVTRRMYKQDFSDICWYGYCKLRKTWISPPLLNAYFLVRGILLKIKLLGVRSRWSILRMVMSVWKKESTGCKQNKILFYPCDHQIYCQNHTL